MDIDIKTFNNIAVVELTDKLDIYHAALLPRTINELIDRNTRSVIFNLEKLIFIDSSGIGVLITAMGELKKAGGALKITGLNEFTAPIFRITNANNLFDIYETETDAVNSFKK